jgi:methionyl-tRNA synthetase
VVDDESQKRRHYAKEVIDKYDGIIRKSFSDFGISFDNYSRTSAIIMIRLRNFFRKLYEQGDFIEVTEQLYDAKADQFLADRFVRELAQNVATKKPTVTNAKNVVRR